MLLIRNECYDRRGDRVLLVEAKLEQKRLALRARAAISRSIPSSKFDHVRHIDYFQGPPAKVATYRNRPPSRA